MPNKRRPAFICDLGYSEATPLIAPPPTTSHCEPHTPAPKGYIAWDEWAERMTETHDQRPCKGCDRYLIWEPKRGATDG